MNSINNFWRLAISCLLVAGLMSCEMDSQNEDLGSEKALTGTCAETNTIMAGVIDENAAGLDTFFLELYHYPVARIAGKDSVLWEDGKVIDSSITTDRTFRFDLKPEGHHTLVVYYQGEEVGRMNVADLAGPDLKVVSVPVYYKPQHPNAEPYRFVYADHLGNDSLIEIRINSKFVSRINKDAQLISFRDTNLARITAYHQNDSGHMYISEFSVDNEHQLTYISSYKLPNSIQGPGEWNIAVYPHGTYEEGDTLLFVVQSPQGYTDSADFVVSFSRGKLWEEISPFKFPNANNGEFKWVIPENDRPHPYGCTFRVVDPGDVKKFAQSGHYRILAPRIVSPIGMGYADTFKENCPSASETTACIAQHIIFYADTNLVKRTFQYENKGTFWGSYSLWGIDSIKTRFGDDIEWFKIIKSGRQIIDKNNDTLDVGDIASVRTFK